MQIESGCEYESRPACKELAPVRRVLKVEGGMVHYECVGGICDRLQQECTIAEFIRRVHRKLVVAMEEI